MYKQFAQMVFSLGRKRYPSRSVLSLSTMMDHPHRSYSVSRKKKELEKKQRSPFRNEKDVEGQKEIPELSLTAQRMLLESEQRNKATSSQHTESLVSQTSNKEERSRNFLSRMEDLATDFDNTISDSTAGLKDSAFPKLPDVASNWPEQSIQDDSVETITFLEDVRSTLESKPSLLIGTEDPSIPPSQIPCVGCGAFLQCQHNTFPGFMPSEYFKILTEKEMKVSVCQRCHYIQHCDAFVEVSTEPEEFSRMISQIRPTKSLVVMVVDVMDVPGSIIPDLMQYIGFKHPLVIVGNKADLLAPDDPSYLKYVRNQLEDACHAAGLRNIRKVTLVSAKTGFGIERLINILFSFYQKQVDVFIVGTANAGKSSLFNTLLASDYCKHTARDLIQRATISVWPGTTLNLLKFPIMRPSTRIITLRHQRLKQEKAIEKYERKVQESRKKEKKEARTWELKEMVTPTDLRTDGQRTADETGVAWGQNIVGYKGRGDGTVEMVGHRPEPTPLEPENFSQSYWTYDTPGVINPDQIMNMLTTEEAPFLAPATMIVPRCLIFKPDETVFLSGLSRLDFVEGEKPVILTVHSAPNLPIHVVPTAEADLFYAQNVGTDKLGIPLGDKERLLRLPSLIGKEFTVQGKYPDIASADIQLSSLGWISVAPRTEGEVRLRAYTPGRKGMYVRVPAMMPYFTAFKGKHIRGTPFYHTQPPGWVIANSKIKKIEDS